MNFPVQLAGLMYAKVGKQKIKPSKILKIIKASGKNFKKYGYQKILKIIHKKKIKYIN